MLNAIERQNYIKSADFISYPLFTFNQHQICCTRAPSLQKINSSFEAPSYSSQALLTGESLFFVCWTTKTLQDKHIWHPDVVMDSFNHHEDHKMWLWCDWHKAGWQKNPFVTTKIYFYEELTWLSPSGWAPLPDSIMRLTTSYFDQVSVFQAFR